MSNSQQLAEALGISFPDPSSSRVLLVRDGKQYEIDAARHSVREVGLAPVHTSVASSAAAIFARNCAVCHGRDGQGNRAIGTPDFKDRSVQAALSDTAIRSAIHDGKGGRMPAWSGKLSDGEIGELASYIRSFSSGPATVSAAATPVEQPAPPSVYQAGDDVLVSLPTGRAVDRHGVYVNFAHRFAFDPAFTGRARGAQLFGLDGFAIPSLGLRYGLTDKLSVSVFRSPTIIGRPIQLAAGYHLLDEHQEQPLNLTLRFSIEGQDNFQKNFTENIEAIFSRSLSRFAQFYFVPTASFNDRPLTLGGNRIASLPGTNAFSIGIGGAVDIRPTVALLAEVIPTVVNGRDLGIHRPAFSFGIQKKLYRHAFTLGFTNGPGITVSQRAGTRAELIGDPGGDKPSKLFIGFDLTRQIR